MKKEMVIEGMHCVRCQERVEKALSAVAGVASAKVNLKNKTALIVLSGDVADQTLLDALMNLKK